MQLSAFQQFFLVTLRTVIGWHFAYEGFYKLMLPGWTRAGERVASFSAAGYLKGATGPFRVKIRSASFSNVSILPWMLRGVYAPDIITILASLYFILGDIDR